MGVNEASPESSEIDDHAVQMAGAALYSLDNAGAQKYSRTYWDRVAEVAVGVYLSALETDPYASIRCVEFPETPSPGNLAMKDDTLYCWSPGGGWKPVPPHPTSITQENP
jgi:hypothetical protein